MMTDISEILLTLHNTPRPDRITSARELCEPVPPAIRELYETAALIPLGMIRENWKTEIIYQTQEGQIGSSEL